TGGGLLENIPRVLPDGCRATINARGWELPPIFSYLQAGGQLAPEEMARTFNCGIGMAVIVSADDAGAIIDRLEGANGDIHRPGADIEDVYTIGRIESGPRGCTVSGQAGTWNSAEDWSVTHHA
ncbi:MAG TPA: AIR synthase-related protein, partial [Sphingomicrobium sp.]